MNQYMARLKGRGRMDGVAWLKYMSNVHKLRIIEEWFQKNVRLLL